MKNVSQSKMHWVWSVRHRLFVSVLFAMAVAVFLPPDYLPLTRMLCIWNAGAVNFLILTWMLMLQGTPEMMRHHAQQLDAGRLTILSSIVGAAFASFLAIFFLLRDTKGLSPNLLFLHLGLSVLTIVGSWMQVHTIFTMHYAHSYYGNRSKQEGSYLQAGGLDFPGDEEPDYKDFLYFSFGIGMTCQVADVQTTSRSTRYLVLFHSVLSFFFNTAILAMSVNIIAGLS
ncbi:MULTISPECIES: DUF1345 domain-containing protein [unclassified Microcoleus]|uniref:DUF1345 domain-containing protein n=1 Tax=unclassified Microcoleus TaxID=2642155 RepID=UPI0025E0FDC4|nr:MULTISPECIES: DUF1345 domain-containing protein [unclassified Microcoleus]